MSWVWDTGKLFADFIVLEFILSRWFPFESELRWCWISKITKFNQLGSIVNGKKTNIKKTLPHFCEFKPSTFHQVTDGFILSAETHTNFLTVNCGAKQVQQLGTVRSSYNVKKKKSRGVIILFARKRKAKNGDSDGAPRNAPVVLRTLLNGSEVA